MSYAIAFAAIMVWLGLCVVGAAIRDHAKEIERIHRAMWNAPWARERFDGGEQ